MKPARGNGGTSYMALNETEVEALLGHLEQGVMLCDAGGRVVFTNPAARRLLPHGADGALRVEALRRGAREVRLAANGSRHAVALILPVTTPQSTLAEQERTAILQALEVTHGRLAETARRLGISRTTLWRRLKAYQPHLPHQPPL